MAGVAAKVADGRILALVEAFLGQSVLEDTQEWVPEQGTPQGAVISPLLSNIYLDPLDHLMAARGFEMVRYADDFVVLCRTPQEAAEALAVVEGWTAQAGLTLHPEKTRLVHAWDDGFDFLGYRFARGRRWPCRKSMGKLKDAIRAKTGRTVGQALPRVIADVNPTLRGWYGTSSTATARRSAWSTAGFAAGCGASCGGDAEQRGSHRRTAPIRHGGRMPSLLNMGCSACRTPMMRFASPLVGNTTDWRAGCGRSASPVRREGEAVPLPTPIVVAECHDGWPGQARP